MKVDYGVLENLIKRDVEFRIGTMYHLGKMSRHYLKRTPWLRTRGPGTLKYKGWGKKGKYKIHNWVTKRGEKVIFTSPPLNLFEFGRNYKGVGTIPYRKLSATARKRYIKEPGKNILTGKFKRYLERSVSRNANLSMIKAFKHMGDIRGVTVG